jgi:hypothetical protein
MKKLLSIFLAALMLLTIIPTAFAASVPSIKTTVDKTTIKVGDIVTVKATISAKSQICALGYELSYKASDFEYVSHELGGVFSLELAQNNETSNGENVFKYAGTTEGCHTGAAATLLTVKLRAKKTNGKIYASLNEAYTSTGGDDYVNVLPEMSKTSNTSFAFKSDAKDYIKIKTPSNTTIRYKDGIVLHAETNTTLPSGATIKWTASNGNFKTSESDNGKKLTIISESNGKTVFTATLYSASGSVIETETIEMTSKAGFFDKIGGFFRNLFGTTKIYAE